MKKILYFFTIFLTLCTADIHNAYASSNDDTRKITVSWELNTDPAEYSTSISNYTVTTFNKSCKSEPDANNPQKHYSSKSEQTFTCKKDIQSLALTFRFYNRPTGVKNFTKTLTIKNNKDKYKIEETLQYQESTTERQTRLTKCSQNIPRLFERYCDDEGYRTGTQVGDGPSWGEFMIADGKISIGCYTYKKRKDANDLIAALKKECNLSDGEITPLTPTRPDDHIPENAITVPKIYDPGSATISGIVILYDRYKDTQAPCNDCKILIESTQEEIGTTDANGNFSDIHVPNKNEQLEFKYNEDYETYTTYPEHIEGPIYLDQLTISGYIKTKKGTGNGISDATITNLRTKESTNTYNDSGSFSLLPARPTDKIEISAEGYKTQNVDASVFNSPDTDVIIMEPGNGAPKKTSDKTATHTASQSNTNIKWPIHGTVFDNNGDPLPGAYVIIPEAQYTGGSQCGANTTKDGKWEIRDCIKIPSAPKLEITFIGFTTKEIPLSSFKNGDEITLEQDGLTLNNLLVTECRQTDENHPGAIVFERASDDKCYPTACDEPRYKLTGTDTSAKCEEQKCEISNARAEWTGEKKAWKCIVQDCKDGYKVSDDGKSCIEIEKPKLSREDSQKKIDELQENADAMKEKEQSTANKLLGGAAIGATGIGAMQAASAYSEQAADEDAEQAMKAYLATFHCNYGGGINVPGGKKDVQLPGGNELIDLYAEYVNLANNLKVRKAALDMRPGIESEPILDSATSGLYDDVAIGKTSGAFTSLARALMDPNGADAAAWAAQKDDSAQKMKTGLTTAGIGAIGGAVGNLLINKDSETEKSKEINEKYEKLKKQVKELQQIIDNLPQPTCDNFKSRGVNGGTYPDCTCKNSNERFFVDKGCVACDTGQEYNAQNQCVPIDCNLSGDMAPGKCECAENATETENKCKCKNGYTNTDGKCNKIKKPATVALGQNEPIPLSIPTDTTFESGKAELKPDVKQKISKEINRAIQGLGDDKKSAAAAIKYFNIEITGHTDRIPFKKGSKTDNQKLSEERAEAIKKLFVDAGVNKDTITTSGKADTECTRDKYKNDNDQRCRKVEIKITLNPAGNILQNINIGELAEKLTGSTTTN